jgi:oxaloacetate decarboxylase alpha subunit
MTRIEIIDQTLRDAHQSLWATRMTTAMMLPVAEKMDRIGFAAIDLFGQPQFDACLRYLREDPWQRLRLMRERATRAPLCGWMRSKGMDFSGITPEDVMELWIRRMIANGVRQISSFDGLNDIDNIVFPLSVAKACGVHTVGALAYSHSPVHTDGLYVKLAKGLIEKTNIDAVLIKDSGGLLTLDRIRTLVPAVKAVIGDVPLDLHSHNTTGYAALVYLEAARLGVNRLHTSIAPLANGTAQPSTQSVVRNLREMGFTVDLDMDLVDEVSDHFTRVAAEEGKPVGVPLEYDAFHYAHQVPGGMISNFKASLEEAGVAHKLDEVLRECARVREDLGWPKLITPFAQLVGIQAMLNVMSGERYRHVPDGVKRYALGYWGKLLAPVQPDVLDKIVENGTKDIALEPEPPEPGLPALRRRFPDADDDELLLRTLLPGSHVDEMLARRPTPTV